MESKLERIIFTFLGTTAGIVVGIFILSYPIPIIDDNIDVFIVILTAIIGSLAFIISIYYKKDKIAKENEKNSGSGTKCSIPANASSLNARNVAAIPEATVTTISDKKNNSAWKGLKEMWHSLARIWKKQESI